MKRTVHFHSADGKSVVGIKDVQIVHDASFTEIFLTPVQLEQIYSTLSDTAVIRTKNPVASPDAELHQRTETE